MPTLTAFSSVSVGPVCCSMNHTITGTPSRIAMPIAKRLR